MISRVLYRLRFFAEQAPFDAATFSYSFPLLEQVIQQGGIAIDEEEEALEQVTLTLDFIRFHCGECERHPGSDKDCESDLIIVSDSAYPRKHTMEQILHLIRTQPKLSKNGSVTLIDLGEAVSPTATREEVDVLLKSTLVTESHLRNACLQAIQVGFHARRSDKSSNFVYQSQPFDLTDLDWSPELWIACHDDDEQNARFARHVWEDNGLDVPETYMDELSTYLGELN